MFDVAFDPASGQQTVTLKVGYSFVAGDPSTVAPGFRPEEFQWTPEEQVAWKARYQADVSAQWSAQYQFQCSRPFWDALLVKVAVVVVENRADPHFVLTVSKYPDDADMAQSSICPPGTHHDPGGGNICPVNPADASGNPAPEGSGQFDSNDLRPEQKLDWNNASLAVPFRSGSARLSAEGSAAVAAIVAQLQADAAARVELTGHASTTHRRGSDAATGQVENMDMARARSESVRAAIAAAGIAAAGIAAAGIAAARVQLRNAGEQAAAEGDEWCRVDAQVGNRQQQSPALHETGHMLGMGDEYPTTGAAAGTPVDPAYDAMVHNTTGEVLARARDDSAMSVGSTVQRWHYSSFMEALCELSGVQEWKI